MKRSQYLMLIAASSLWLSGETSANVNNQQESCGLHNGTSEEKALWRKAAAFPVALSNMALFENMDSRQLRASSAELKREMSEIESSYPGVAAFQEQHCPNANFTAHLDYKIVFTQVLISDLERLALITEGSEMSNTVFAKLQNEIKTFIDLKQRIGQ